MNFVVDEIVGQAPQSVSENDLLVWYNAFSSETASKIEIFDFSGEGGLSAAMRKTKFYFENVETRTYIFKSVAATNLLRSKQLELAREAYFYHYFSKNLMEIGVNIPFSAAIHGNFKTGEKYMLLEDLSDYMIQSGYFFGPGSPHNWGKDLDKLTSTRKVSSVEITVVAFKTAAKLHAKYWLDRESLFKLKWL
jgi:hypothetical protein